jgi:hypothetical protein
MTNQPIGFWLKHLDELIEDSFDHALARDGLQRRHWQTLHLLSSSSAVNETAIEEALRPFFANDSLPRLSDVLEDLLRRGWITRPGLALTAEGTRAHARLAERVRAMRAATVDGISPVQYTETLGVLERMADNLVRAMASG